MLMLKVEVKGTMAKNKKQKPANNENAYQTEFASETNVSNAAANKASKNANSSKC